MNALKRKSPLKRSSSLSRGAGPKRSGRIKKINVERKAKHVAANRKFYASAGWKATRLATFEHDGWRCTAIVERAFCDNFGNIMGWLDVRCPEYDETHTGNGLVCDEVRYGRRGRERIGIDTRTLCKACNQRETAMHRANHANGFNNSRR